MNFDTLITMRGMSDRQAPHICISQHIFKQIERAPANGIVKQAHGTTGSESGFGIHRRGGQIVVNEVEPHGLVPGGGRQLQSMLNHQPSYAASAVGLAAWNTAELERILFGLPGENN